MQRLSASVAALAAFPEALAALQRDISGLHDRLAPLGDVRAGMADLQARTSAAEALRSAPLVTLASALQQWQPPTSAFAWLHGDRDNTRTLWHSARTAVAKRG